MHRWRRLTLILKTGPVDRLLVDRGGDLGVLEGGNRMELFLSYSRRDSSMSDRLRADLETAGHSVWLDRDDLRGGEQWRASLVNAIANTDRVVLLVSPHSVSSDNVARELSIAEDQDKRIIPVVLEPSDLPPEFQYLLAGVQYISFDEVPYDTALVELLDALGTPAPAGSGAKFSVSTGANGSRPRKWLKVGSWAIAAIALLFVTLNQDIFETGVDGEQASTQPNAGTASAGQSTTMAPYQELDLGGSAWLAGVKFSPRDATHDTSAGRLTVHYDVEVEQTEQQDFYGLFPSMTIELTGTGLPRACENSGPVPGLSESTADITFCDVPAGTDLAGASLTFGSPTEQRWTLPMTPSAEGVGPEPIRLDTGGRVVAEGLYYDIEKISVVPWSCSKANDGGTAFRGVTAFAPVSSDRYSVVMMGTMGSEKEFASGNGVGEGVSLRQNDKQFASVGFYTLYHDGQSATHVPLCFLVDSPPNGSYTLNWSSLLGGADTFEFQVP